MKKFLLLYILLALSCTYVAAQTFTGTFTGTAANLGATSTQKCFPVTVSGIGSINSTIGLSSVCINLTHPELSEVEVVLRAPDGTIVPLSIENGGSGANYQGTCFSATATTSVKFGSAPFSGSYLPQGYLGEVNNGQNANGTWNICVLDRRNGGNTGKLNNFTLTFSTSPAPQPPAKPACAMTIPSNSSCNAATAVCDFNGICGSTAPGVKQDWTGSGLDGPCFNLQNNTFLKFVASSTVVSFSVWVNSSTSGYPGGGIQMLFFQGTCGSSTGVTTLACYEHILPNSTASKPTLTVITANGMTPGNTYYLMIDGFSNDNCSYTIAANSGVNVLNIDPTAATICKGDNVNLTASGGNGVYAWTPILGLNTATGATVNASPATTTTYTVTSVTASGCPLTDTVKVTVNNLPVITTQPSTTPQDVCKDGTVSPLNITATPGSGSISGYQWYSNTVASNTGGTLITNATGASYTPLSTSIGTTYYYVIVNNSNGCADTSNVSGAINIVDGPAQPLLDKTDPTCTVTTGSIQVNPLIPGLTYSSDGVNYTNTTGTFTDIAPGASYSITAKNATGCKSIAATGTMGTAPGAPAQPNVTPTNPTCATGTGTLTVTSSTTGLTFSSDGINYTNTTGVFNNIAAGAAYNITAKNAAGCTSPAATGTMGTAPGAPAQPIVSPTNPTCATPTGTLTVTSTTTDLNFSSDGIDYTNTTGIFTNIAAGSTYSITAKNAAGCTSSAATGTMGTAPGAPSQPIVSPTNPTCATSTGTLTVTSTITGLTFSSDGINYTNTTGVFNNIASGAAYSITAKNAAGCTSTAATGTMGTAPSTPTQPVVTPTNPTCATSTGTLTVTSSTTGLTFSSDGIDYTNTTGIFTNITAGSSYSITAKNAAGCTSSAATGTMGIAPGAPVQPIVSPTNPTCTTSTGTLTVTSSTSGLTFSSDGINYTNTTGVFNNIASGATYSITAKNAAGCTSAAATGTMGIAPSIPTQPTVTPTDPTCTTATGTLTVTSTTAGLTFSNDGINYTNTTGIFNNIASGAAYSITAKNGAGCISAAATGTMGIAPSTPTQPTVNPTNPTCTNPTGTLTVTSTTTGLTFSSDEINYTNSTGIFNNIAGGSSYSITAKNTAGCISIAATGTMGTAPPVPAQPIVTPTNPTCTNATGTLTVTSNTTGLTFSNDGINYTNTTGVFNNIAGGSTYSITAKNSAGCVSIPATGTMGNSPSTPLSPIVTITTPTCAVVTGSIQVAPLVAGLSYSNNGGNYNTTGTFSNIAPGAAYSIVAKNAAGCISNATIGTMAAVPSIPSAPLLTVVNNCGSSTVTASNFTGALIWNDGGSGSSRTFNTAVSNLTATQIVNSCVSQISNIVSTTPAVALTPDLGNDVFLCPSERVILNPGNFDQYTWQDNSGAKTFTVTQSGTYSVSVKNNNNPCIAKDSVKVTYFVVCNDIYFPTAFTPNGDGSNDKFGPSGNLNQVTAYKLNIYNRLGELVFRSTNPFVKWDGYYLGSISSGNYVWQSDFLFNGKARTHKGNLVVIK
ncbi:MAG: gliding motility-associated C-terminal domain-containing protein [Bacteroidota bacterium]